MTKKQVQEMEVTLYTSKKVNMVILYIVINTLSSCVIRTEVIHKFLSGFNLNSVSWYLGIVSLYSLPDIKNH